MKKQSMEGEPYKDAKTYGKWLEVGYQVKRGEKSTLNAMVIIEKKTKKGIKKFARKYNSFHKSQVKKMKNNSCNN